MFIRLAIFASLVIALMVGIRDGSLLKVGGLTGTCSTTYTSLDGTALEACRAGKLEGFPDLSKHGCTNVGERGKAEYWSCPGTLTASQVGR